MVTRDITTSGGGMGRRKKKAVGRALVFLLRRSGPEISWADSPLPPLRALLVLFLDPAFHGQVGLRVRKSLTRPRRIPVPRRAVR
jgi:hypothetical protein